MIACLMTEDRLNKLEVLVAYQEQQIQDLSDMINLHRKEIDVLMRRLEVSQGKLAALEAAVGDGRTGAMSVTEEAALNKPPHY